MVSEEMVRILETDAEKAKAAASYVLWDLSRYSPFLLSESGAIPVLVELFQNTDGDIREKPSPNRDAILLAGAIPVLVDLLRGELDEVKDYAAECLINFAEDPLYRVQLCGEKLAMRIKGGLLAAREVSALELYKLESGSPKSNWQLISDIKRRTNTTGLGEEDMLCIMSGPNKDADGSSVIITTTGNIKDNKNDSVHLQLL
ncbi:hypothetical protein MUK42_07979, partial [Musa troglodytarum]